MCFRSMPVSVFVISAALLAPSQAFATGYGGTTRVVDNDGMATASNCSAPNPTFMTINAAVTASSSGDTILVCDGTYNEQVRIVTKNLTIRGIADGNLNAAVVKPLVVVQNSNSANPLSSQPNIAAIIAVEGSTKVTLDNLTVDGSSGIGACAPTFVGVFYRNASGTVQNMAVRFIQNGVGLEGCQSGIGIFAQSGSALPFPGGIGGAPSKLTVFGTSVHDYQKTGIQANENGTELTAFTNAVTGLGPTPLIAQNGIQVGFGAKGLVSANSVVNNIYSLCTAAGCSFVSTNILIFDSNNVKVLGNIVAKAQVSIYAVGNNLTVSANAVSDSDVFDGIDLVGNNNRAEKNLIFNSDDAGIYLEGNGNYVKENTINEAPCGVAEESLSSGNVISGNVFFNTAMKKCTVVLPLAAQTLSSQGTVPAVQPMR